jgi:hypothetical protein
MLMEWTLGGSDIIYGGLGDDFLHGGGGDDAISGAEALLPFYNEAPQTDTDPLRINPTTHLSAWWTRSTRWSASRLLPRLRHLLDRPDHRQLLLIDGGRSRSTTASTASSATPAHDWLVGGTYFDWLFGGWGYDLLDADDNHWTTAASTHARARGLVVRPGRLRLRRRRSGRPHRQHGDGPPVRLARATSTTSTCRSSSTAPDGQPLLHAAIARFIRRLAYAGGTDVLLTPFEPFDEPAIIPGGTVQPGLPAVRPAALARRAAQRPRRAARQHPRHRPDLRVLDAAAARAHGREPAVDGQRASTACCCAGALVRLRGGLLPSATRGGERAFAEVGWRHAGAAVPGRLRLRRRRRPAEGDRRAQHRHQRGRPLPDAARHHRLRQVGDDRLDDRAGRRRRR